MVRIAFLLFLITYTLSGYGQDISGKWYGNFGKSARSIKLDELVIEFELYNDSLIKGTSRLFYSRNDYEEYLIKGVYRKADSSIHFKEVSEVEVRPGTLNSNVMGTYNMKLNNYNGVIRFEGEWYENEVRYGGKVAVYVWLQKRPPLERIDHDEVLNDKPLIVTPPKVTKKRIEHNTPQKSIAVTERVKVSDIAEEQPRKAVKEDINLKRNTSIDKKIALSTSDMDSIRIEIIDNAKIDGDVISIYVNDRLVRHKQKISDVPVVFYVGIEKGKARHTIKVAAESYGSMPPCTSHVTVTTSDNKYEFDLESYFNKNAAFTLETGVKDE